MPGILNADDLDKSILMLPTYEQSEQSSKSFEVWFSP